MRKLIVLSTLFFAFQARAAVPSAFSVEGVLRDSSGKLQSMMVSVSASLFDAQTAGNKLAGPYGPTMVMATNGLFTLPITDGSLQTELAGASQVWIEITAGSDTFARQPVNAQIYSLMCGTADVAKSLPGITVANGQLGVGTTSAPLANLQVQAKSDPSGGTNSLLLGLPGFAPIIGTGIDGGQLDLVAGIPRDPTSPSQTMGGMIILGGSGRADNRVNSILFLQNNVERMRINDGGNVGIGTATPAAELAVHSGTHADLNIGPLDSDAAAASRFYLSTSGGGYGPDSDMVLNVPSGKGFEFAENGGDVVIIDSSGRVGIGTQPAVKLHVTGDIRVGTSGSNGCVQNFAGTALTGTCSSDARFKKNIVPISGALDNLDRIQPVTYEWREKEFPERHFGPGKNFGLIAQEVEKVLPELVTTDDKGYKAVSYGVPVEMQLLQAIKELRVENRALKERLASIEARLDSPAAR